MALVFRFAARASLRSSAARSKTLLHEPLHSRQAVPFCSRPLASALGTLESLRPLHSAVASARLISNIAVDSSCWSFLSQEEKERVQLSHPMLLRSRLILIESQPITVKGAAPAILRPSSVHFCSGSAEPTSKNMEKTGQDKQNLPPIVGDIMSDSFGHEYSTRSDDEGFGGIYGRNQSLQDTNDQPLVDEDVKQGSEGRERPASGGN